MKNASVCIRNSLQQLVNVMKYDYLIVGSGLFGATFAYHAKLAGKKCLVIDERNNALADEYRALAAKEENVIFGGRLAEYKYYDMDDVIEAALGALDGIIK